MELFTQECKVYNSCTMESDLTYVWLSNNIAASPEQLISTGPLITELTGESVNSSDRVSLYRCRNMPR